MQNLDRPSHPEIPRWRRTTVLPAVAKAIRLAFAAAVIAGIALLVPGIARSQDTGDTSAAASNVPPLIGVDHWHATYDIWICGEHQPALPEWEAGIHTHGDGIIHMHPFNPDEEGPGAALGKFFEYGGGLLTDNEMRLPGSDTTHANGDMCPNGSEAAISVQANGSPVDDYAAYIPKDGDAIVISFGQIAVKGDVDCDGDVDVIDALKELQHVAGLLVSQESGCPEIGSDFASIFGDIDCHDDITAVDALFILRFVAGLQVSLPPGCPPLGQ